MLKLAEANRAIVAAKAYARDHGYLISVTVVDAMGHLIAHQRMDGALLLSSYGSVGKAIAAAGLGLPSGEESDVDLNRSSVSGILAHGLSKAALELVARRRINRTRNVRAAVSELSVRERRSGQKRKTHE